MPYNGFVTTATSAPDTEKGMPVVPPQAIVRMTVLYHVASLDMYMLIPSEGPELTSDGFILGSWNRLMSPYGLGTHGGSTLVPGTRVLVLSDVTLGYADIGSRCIVKPIVSVDNEMPASDTYWYPPWTMNGSRPIDTVGADTQILQCQEVDKTDRLRGAPMDLAPGDWEIGNPLKGHLFVGGIRVGMEASPVAGIHMYGDDSTIVFNKGLRYIEDTPWGRYAETTDKFGSFSMAHRADSFAEAMGGDTATEVVTNGQNPQTLQKGVAMTISPKPPKWSGMSYDGKSVGGSVNERMQPGKNSPRRQASFGFDGVDGTVMKGAARSLTLTRTPGLPYLEMTREFEDEDTTEATDASPLPEYPDDYATQYADLMYELMKRRFVERYWARQKNDKGWTALSMSEMAEQISRYTPVLRPLDGDAPAYKDDLLNGTDPLTGLADVVSKLESYIHLSDTGALVISDGVGSEIRMEGGHIVLSPAADLRLQPGRDMTATVPRTFSVFGRDRVELTSDRGEVDIHAAGNAVLSAEGVATVESRGTRQSSSSAYDQRGAGGGVVIRSATGTHVVGESIRLAVQASDDRSRDGVKGKRDGMIVIEGGNAPVAVNGSSVAIHGLSSTSLSAGEAGCGVVVGDSAIGLLSTDLTISAKNTLFGGSGVMEWIDSVNMTTTSVRVPSPDSLTVTVKGNLRSTSHVTADSVSGKKGFFQHLKSLNAKKKESLFIQPSARPSYLRRLEPVSEAAAYFMSLSSMLDTTATEAWFRRNRANPLMTADGVVRAGIYYPKASGYHQSNGFWTPSRWQRMMEGAPTWTPTPVKDADDKDMLPFPGMDGWNEGGFLKTLSEDGTVTAEPLSGNWTINSK